VTPALWRSAQHRTPPPRRDLDGNGCCIAKTSPGGTTIHARAQLLDRAVKRAPGLSDEERGRMREGITVITRAVHEMAALIDSMRDAGAEGRNDTE
jgi:hypothetical protein